MKMSPEVIAQYKGVFVFAQQVDNEISGIAFELLGKAKELAAAIKEIPDLVFEGHSTDYQTKIKLREMVEDGVAIFIRENIIGDTQKS